ncbi:MAG: hypothetical protein LBT00_13715 [Spirochaetaceae bacterium]|jgi:hypothetical protein|nr:hypothetical protein [Spirochaetaceae bacterium]
MGDGRIARHSSLRSEKGEAIQTRRPHTPYLVKGADNGAMDEIRENAKKILNGKPIVAANSTGIPVKDGKIVDTAMDWIKNNPQAPAQTVLGIVKIDEGGVEHDFARTRYINKPATLPAVKTVLENGAYLLNLPDFTGKPVTNHYFAAPTTIDSADKYVRLFQNLKFWNSNLKKRSFARL